MAGANQAARHDVRAGTTDLAGHAEVDSLMRRFLDQDQVHTAASAAMETPFADAPNDHPRRDFDMASDLLDRASQAFDLLINRCQRLEQDLDDARASAEARIAEQAETIEQWRRLAAGLKAQAEASDKAAAAAQARCDTAEARAAMVERRVASLERASAHAASHAAQAEQQSIKLHDKVVLAFGIGSRAHPVLDAVATHQAAE